MAIVKCMGKPVDSHCRAFQAAIDILGKPWNALILNVLQPGPLRFTELAVQAEGPGDKVLSQRLKELEACGLIGRSVDPGPPTKVRCGLPTKGPGSAEGPGEKVLSQGLKELEARGLIERSVDPGPPIKVSYELTTKGRGFGEVAA